MLFVKKILLALFLGVITFNSVCLAATPEPSKKIVLFYKVSDAVIQCQNSSEDMAAGTKELEKELNNHYSKRFIVQGVQRLPQDTILTAAEYFNKVKFNQIPFIVKIKLEGQGQSTTLYQNAFGAQKYGVSPSTKVHLEEATLVTNDDSVYIQDYGIKSYSSGTFAVGRDVYAAQTDPRKNTKNAIRACFRDACEFNDNINKYANPAAYEREYNRFTGNFKALTLAGDLAMTDTNTRIEKFKTWCNADDSRKICLITIGVWGDSPELMISYIDSLIKMGVYKE